MATSPYEFLRIAVVGYFQASFVQPDDPTRSFLPYSLPNYEIDQPNDSQGNPTPWCRLSINEGRTQGRDVGGGSTRTPGVLYLQVFIPEKEGTSVARQAADLMTERFQYVTLELPDGVLRFREVSFRGNLGAINGFDRSNVEVEFLRDTYTQGTATPVAVPTARLDASGILTIRNRDTGAYEIFDFDEQPGN